MSTTNDILTMLSELWTALVEDHPKIDYDDILHRIEKVQLMVFGRDGEANGKKERQKRKTT